MIFKPHVLDVVLNGSFLFTGGEFTSPNQEKFHHYKVQALHLSGP
jgi:hypothetical protein